MRFKEEAGGEIKKTGLCASQSAPATERAGGNIGQKTMHVHVELPEDIAQAMSAGGQDLKLATE
jgi:hypothetical protein